MNGSMHDPRNFQGFEVTLTQRHKEAQEWVTEMRVMFRGRMVALLPLDVMQEDEANRIVGRLVYLAAGGML